MLTYTVYSEAGGVGKSSLSANLAAAHSRADDDVLLIDLDPQDGSVSYLLDVHDDRENPNADNLARHLIDDGRGPFRDLVRTADQEIDVVPSHAELEQLTEWLIRAEERNDWAAGERYQQLLRVLQDAGVDAAYDVIVVDPPATTSAHLYNAIYATRSLVIPVELSGKGQQSVEGLAGLVEGIEDTLGITVGVLAIVPNGVKGTSDQEAYRERIESQGFDVPVVIRDRASLIERCWDQQATAYSCVRYDYEEETLDKYDQLAAHLSEVTNHA